jgi:hypothetical protein
MSSSSIFQKTMPCLRCKKELIVSTKCHRAYCPECLPIIKRERCRTYQQEDNAETKKKCTQCKAKLNYRNTTGLCIKCSKKLGMDSTKWKGGRHISSNGYVFIHVREDDFFAPMRDHHGYVLEHRLVMAKHLKRCLLPWEIVHHKNGKKSDNAIENLELITDKRFHMVDMASKNYIKRLENKILVLENKLMELRMKRNTTAVAKEII